jgi:long-chain acyl-CoA synthetase
MAESIQIKRKLVKAVYPWHKHYDPGVPVTIDYPAHSLVYFLEDTARCYPHQLGMILNHEELTYAQIETQVHQAAQEFVRLGIKKGDRVGLWLPNLPEFVIAFYGVLKAGGVVMAFNPQYKAREIEHQANDSGIELLVVTGPLYRLAKEVQPRTRIKKIIVVQRNESFEIDRGVECGPEDILWRDLIDRPLADDQSMPAVGPEDPAIFQYTGGTTGVPKCAIGLHRNLVANTLQFRHWLVNVTEGQETLMLAIPMYHVYGMVLGMSLGVMLGATLVLAPNPRDLNSLLASLQRHRVTIFPGVPNLYHSIILHPDVQAGRTHLQTIKACISGSAPLPRLVKEQFESLTGGKLVEGYGLSEAPTATHCNPIMGENRAGSIGLPLPDVECRIVSLEDGATLLGPEGVGELAIRGPQVMAGYHGMPEETRLTLKDGWLYTGDIARMDQEGYFYLVDRKKDVIKSGGFQVWPNEVEAIINTHPQVLESAVAGVIDPWQGEVVKAWIVLKSGDSLSEWELTGEEIQAWCRKVLAGYKIPQMVEFRTSLPRTMVGKILRRELVREHQLANQ